MALSMVDTEATPLWAVGLLFAWFVASVFLAKRVLSKLQTDKQ